MRPWGRVAIIISIIIVVVAAVVVVEAVAEVPFH